MLISAPFFSSLLYKDDTNCFLDTNHNGKLTVVRILLKVTLIILTIPILPNCVTFIWALSQVPITSSLKLIKFSTVENFIKVKNNKIFTIGNICIETINCTPNIAGVRTINIESNFKNIFSIFLTGYITEGQTQENLMRQVVHGYYSKIVATKQVKIYASGTQSLELTIIGTI